MMVIEAFKQTIQLLGLLDELDVFQEYVDVYCNSQSSTKLAKNQVYYSRMKHIDIPFHFFMEMSDENDIFLRKIGTTNNPHDMLTKFVYRESSSNIAES